MALALIYIFATAKPISIRRLAALFISTLILAVPTLAIFQIRNVREGALIVAASVTLLVWSIPMLRALRDILRRWTCPQVHTVSARIQWTYAFAIAAGLILGASAMLHGTRVLHLGEFARLVAMICIAATILQVGFCLSSSMRSTPSCHGPNRPRRGATYSRDRPRAPS